MSIWTDNVETFLGCESSYAKAQAVLLGAPYDGTTSYRPGTRSASRTMRSESFSLETYSPYQDRDLADYPVFDGGDLELPFARPEAVLEIIEDKTATVMADGKTPVLLGGEHLVTLGAIRAASRQHPDLAIIQWDAHADLRDDYLGDRLSHATVMRRCSERIQDKSLHQFGIRSGTREEFEFAAAHTHCRRFDLGGLAQTVQSLAGRPVYLSIDLDVLDPSVFPGTGTPEAGGLGFADLMQGLETLKSLQIVGADLCELSPPLDPSGISTAMALKILRELLIVLLSAKES